MQRKIIFPPSASARKQENEKAPTWCGGKRQRRGNKQKTFSPFRFFFPFQRPATTSIQGRGARPMHLARPPLLHPVVVLATRL
jgi:hypothetical protein